MAFVESMDRFTEVSPSRIEVSGLLSSNSTAYGPLVTKLFTADRYDAEASPVLGFSTRFKEATTFAEVNVVPSSNLTPLRSWKVITRLPLLNAQLVARSGTKFRFLS